MQQPEGTGSSRPEAAAFGAPMRARFLVDDSVHFINHGSFGAVPQSVMAAQDRWRREIERQPVDFLTRRLEAELAGARARLAGFVGAGDGRLVFVDNATAGINAVLRSLDWLPGDRILHFDQAYGAVRQTLRFIADRHRVELVEAALPLPLAGPEEALDVVAAALDGPIRLAVIDHITSPTAIVLPVRELIALCRAHGVAVLVDGAHAPGQLPLDIAGLGADWYVGNCHKWLFAPRGCGFLWAREDRIAGLHPAVISHGYGSGFEAEFDWTGTRDYSAWLAVTAAIDFIEDLGFDNITGYIHALARVEGARLAETWGTTVAAPTAMTAAMAAIRLPINGPATAEGAAAINRKLWRDHRIEVPVRALGDGCWARISAQIYNDDGDYAALAEAMPVVTAASRNQA